MDKFDDKLICDNLISAFILKWYCNECKSKDNKPVFYCPFGCTDKNGQKQWISNKWFKYHLQRYHHDSSKVLDMIGMKLCIDCDCTQVIDKNLSYCQLYHQINNIDDKYQQNIFANCNIDENKKHYKCHNGQLLDLNKLMPVYDYNDNISENTLKLVGHALTEALDDLAFISNDKNIMHKKEMRGIIKLKSIGPTFFPKPYRQDNAYFNQQYKVKNQLLYKQQKWKELYDNIEYNQHKINNKKDRQNKNLSKFLLSFNNQNSDSDRLMSHRMSINRRKKMNNW